MTTSGRLAGATHGGRYFSWVAIQSVVEELVVGEMRAAVAMEAIHALEPAAGVALGEEHPLPEIAPRHFHANFRLPVGFARVETRHAFRDAGVAQW
jgi:hypothetical protein